MRPPGGGAGVGRPLEASSAELLLHPSLSEMLEVVKNFETVRKRWLHAEVELKTYKELLVKSDVAKAALEVQLKHARNQLDVEMKKRYKMEGDYQYLVSRRWLSVASGSPGALTSAPASQQRQMQLMCDILVQDSRSSAYLNDEQKSLLAAFDQRGANGSTQRSGKRYTPARARPGPDAPPALQPLDSAFSPLLRQVVCDR